MTTVEAVVFDLDGVLVDSEPLWDEARRSVAAEHGGTWSADATRAMMGMSSAEWSVYMHDRLGVDLPPEQITSRVVGIVEQRYEEHLPLLPGAVASVRALVARWPLGLASSANRPVIEKFLAVSGLRDDFLVTVSSEEVRRGKPAPDVYVAALTALAVPADHAVAVEDSTNGMRAAAAAGMRLIAVPNPHFPPAADALDLATAVVDNVGEVTVDLVVAVGSAGT
jgi:HAD superfamily hydrolase (TIGR01509 family)